ncbi:hypothetical protein C1645_816657 [Glomus cerebriforme]|uniref:Uncharacterized protein n=1 Tax=Glomus cerebriforme TaxID=658196 RepID=A0A397TGB6_9GLOM|nr:hypothetical protein C1645_816657 [Glomus cerebriforme]
MVKYYQTVYPKKYEDFKETCLKDSFIANRLRSIYCVSEDGEILLDFEDIEQHKIYHTWKLPNIRIPDFKEKSVSYLIENLGRIIMDETKEHRALTARSDSRERSRGSSDDENNDDSDEDYEIFTKTITETRFSLLYLLPNIFEKIYLMFV